MTGRPHRVLYAWEWGAGAGHVQRFLPIAEAISQRGGEIIWVLKDRGRLPESRMVDPHQILSCPMMPRCPRANTIPPRNLAAIAWNLGMYEANHLRSSVRDWCRIFKNTSPDLVVQDFGLVAGTVARCLGIQTIRMGTGYTCPPRSELPVDLPWFAKCDTEAKSLISNPNSIGNSFSASVFEKVMDHVETAFRGNGLSAPNRWDEVATGCDEDVVASLPPLDPYASLRVPKKWHGVWGCRHSLSEDESFTANSSPAQVLAYLKPFVHWKPFFDALKALRVPVDLVADGVGEDLLRQCDPAWVRVCKGFRSIASAAQQGMTLINNGNHGSTALSLLHGMPVIACPLYFEQRLTAEAIVRAGVGAQLDVRFPERFCETLNTALHQGVFRHRAKRFQDRYAAHFLDGSERVLDRFTRDRRRP